jgi:type IV secretion system protein VirB10
MKSKIFKQHKKNLNSSQNDDDDDDIEIDSSETSVSGAKSSKIIIIISSAILITAVIYFIFFGGKKNNPVERLEEIKIGESVTNPTSSVALAPKELIKDLIDAPKDNSTDMLEQPKLPEIPTLPELPKDLSFNSSVLPSFLDVAKPQLKKLQNSNNQLIQNQNNNPEDIKPEPPRDPRRSEIVVESGSGGSITSNDDFAGGIVVLNQNPIDKLEKTENTIIPTMVQDQSITIAQGKMMTAILETAINTEMPGLVRGVISRDVYAESGYNVLIPKGSRIYGNYSTQISRGQGRVQINWTRLIRPDGVNMNIGFIASDQFGRSGIDGETDNRYGSVMVNSLLTSILAVGAAIAVEKFSGNSSNSSTSNPSAGTVTTSGGASAQVITDISKTLANTVGEVISNTIDTRPIIRISQGTRINIIVNADMSIPPMRKDR